MIIIADKSGQLGNRLFVFANFISCAIEHRVTLANPSFDEYADYFQTTKEDLFCRYPSRRSLFRGRRKLRSLLFRFTYRLTNSLFYRDSQNRFWSVVRIDEDETYDLSSPQFVSLLESRKLILVQGWLFRDHVNFIKHGDEIRGFFKPLTHFQINIDRLIDGAKSRCDVLVGVHIRHGDYKEFLGGKYFYETEQYVQVMRKVQHLFSGKKVTFLLCSNIKQDKENFRGFDVVFANNHFLEDMYSLAQCNYIMGPPSTYTLWASFYGKVPLYSIEDPKGEVTLEKFQA